MLNDYAFKTLYDTTASFCHSIFIPFMLFDVPKEGTS